METTSATPETTATSSSQTIGIRRLYIKACSFESANISTDALQKPLSPQIEVQYQISSHPISADEEEVLVTIIVSAKQEGGLLWRAQMQQAGLYQLPQEDESQKQMAIHGFCANQLYHYAQVHLSNLVQQGGFPAVILMPVDFWRLYQERVKQESIDELSKPETITH